MGKRERAFRTNSKLRLQGSNRIEMKIEALRHLKGDHFTEEMRLRHIQLRLLYRNVGHGSDI